MFSFVIFVYLITLIYLCLWFFVDWLLFVCSLFIVYYDVVFYSRVVGCCLLIVVLITFDVLRCYFLLVGLFYCWFVLV